MHKLLRDSKEVKMIHTEHKENGTVCHISGNSQVILAELLMTISQVLKAFNKQGVADVVLQGLVDVAEDFASSINDTNFNSKGEKKDD